MTPKKIFNITIKTPKPKFGFGAVILLVNIFFDAFIKFSKALITLNKGDYIIHKM